MATVDFRGTPANTIGDLPSVGQEAPSFALTGADLGTITSEDLRGKRVVLNIFPSVDTGVCAASVRKFNEVASGLENTTVVTVSEDLPFALGRFCGAEGIENVVATSSFRSSFGEDFGVTLVDSAMEGLLSRSVVVLDEDGKVIHSELVPQISSEPDYDAAIAALN